MALLGVLLLLPAVVFAALVAFSARVAVSSDAPESCGAMGCGWGSIFLVGGLVISVVGVLYLFTARALWTRRHRARAIAVVLLVPVVLPAAIAVVTEFFGRQAMLSVLIAVPWGITLFAVIRAKP